ncbi:MAG: right-handed parallel beta-helix repeat-containing protein, partial [Planctomycetota bacterium]
SALSSDPGFTTLPGRIELTNCILWNGENTLFDPKPDGSTIAITYSDIQDGWPGEGNIDADPCFADPGYWANADDPNTAVEPDDPNAVWIDGDYHLKSQAGRRDPASESWIQDDVTSPCIDAGDPNMPVGVEPMPNGSIINMGIYGGTPQASKSYILSKIIYVDDDALGNNDGTSWENAYTFLQDALIDAESAFKRVEIRVAQGIYKPKLETGYRIPGTRITTSYLLRFQLINGVTLLGGYAGLTELNPDTRDFEKYETILSGDLNGDDIDIINPHDLFDEPTRSDNCSSIVIGSGTNRTAVLDGFIITGGRVRRHPAVIDSPTGIGGGMKNYSGSPTINNCTFIGNSAEGGGGGIGNMYDSSPILTNCKFINNHGGRGGGFYNVSSNPTFINCTFTNNYADDGAGMSSSIWSIWEPTQGTGTKLIDCTFEDNNAKRSGGGLIIYGGEPVMTSCEFIGNSASKGGGIYSHSGNPKLTNCQFISNSASEGGGMYNDLDTPKLSNCQFIRNNAQVAGGGLDSNYDANPLLTNCIFIDNSSNRCGGGLAGNNSIYNCIMSGNTAVHNGGAIYGWGEVINCTVIGNKAGRNGGGICTQGITTLVNSIVHSNNALIGDEIYLGLRIVPAGRGGTKEGTPSVMTISYSNVLGGEEEVPLDTDCTLAWESGNIDIDP